MAKLFIIFYLCFVRWHTSCTDKTEETEYIPKITPSNILMFCTGSSQVAVTVFDPDPTISFVHDDTKRIPSSQTCSNVLYLVFDEEVL